MDVRLVMCLAVVVPGALGGYNYQREFDSGLEGVESKRPLNIAQRGASGVFPEHTLPAYTQAIEDGADLIECDLAVTLDREFVCRHDPWLSKSTNVALISKYASKQRTVEFDYYGEVKNITDWFVQDFTLAELKKLRADQPKQQRNQAFDGKFQLLTLDEFLDIAEEGGVGVVIDLEWPRFTNSLEYFENGFEEALVELLNNRGYSKATDPVILQSFEPESLRVLKELTDLPLAIRVHLGIEATDELLSEYSQFCYAVTAWKCAVADHYGPTDGYKNNIRDVNDLVGRVQRAGMKAFLYTFRNEDVYLAWNFNQDPYREYDLYLSLGVDGYFTDYPATFNRFLEVEYHEEKECPVNAGFSARPALALIPSALMAALFWFVIA